MDDFAQKVTPYRITLLMIAGAAFLLFLVDVFSAH